MASFELEQWSDLAPIPQDDGPHPVVRINYSQDFVALMDIFRAVLAKGEYSERVLLLTEKLLSENPGSYTVWQYRRACLNSINADLYKELEYMDSFADENPKNYQIWQHRRVIVELLGDGSKEKEFCEKIFEEDAKNYHAWAHRQWTVKTFNLWEGEMEYVDQCLVEDVRNNSAWNHRWFVIHENPAIIVEESIPREVDFCFESIRIVTKNESSWNYLRGIGNKHSFVVPKILNSLEQFVIESDEHANNYFAIGLLADLRENEGRKESLEIAIGLLKRLVTIDPMRAKSWTRRVHLATAKVQNL